MQRRPIAAGAAAGSGATTATLPTSAFLPRTPGPLPLVGRSLGEPPFVCPIQGRGGLADREVKRILIGNRQAVQNGIRHLPASTGLAMLAVLLLLDKDESERLPAEEATPEGTGIGHVRADTTSRAVLPVSGTGPEQHADDAAVGTARFATHGVDDGAAEHRIRTLETLPVAGPPSARHGEDHLDAAPPRRSATGEMRWRKSADYT